LTTQYKKPLPVITTEAQEFWDGCKNEELLIQKCSDCGTLRWTPRPMCHECTSMKSGWAKVSGKGTVYSYTIVYHPVHPGFVEEVPYTVVLVDLEEGGVRFLSNLVDCPIEGVKVGMPVEVVFEPVTPEVTLPKFRPAKG